MDFFDEENETLEGQKKVMYAQNKNGCFKREKYSCKIEEFATKTAVKEYELKAQEALENIKNGTSSPIEFYMYKCRMDLPTLSANVGMFSFRIKRHFLLKNFKKLNDKILLRYAKAFDIDLKNLKELS